MDYYIITYGIATISLIITLIANGYINSTYKKLSQFDNKKGISGFETARKILDKNNLKELYIVETKGYLTDHYDPNRKVIRLSSDVYNKEVISSVAVAAHECGHAIQDKEKYFLMRVRSFLVPVVNFSSYAGYIAIFIGVISQSFRLIEIGIALECIILLFQLVTLPVEIDASKRAMKELKSLNILEDYEIDYAQKMLIAAALTYVAAVATNLLEILRLVILYGRKGERR